MIFSENEHYGLTDVGLSITNGIYSGTQAYHILNSVSETKKWSV